MESETRDLPETQTPAPRESNLPFALTLAALLIYFGFQMLQLIVQRSELIEVKNSQEQAIQAAQKVEEEFKTVMTKLDEMAKQGHAGAKMVLDTLQTSTAPNKSGS